MKIVWKTGLFAAVLGLAAMLPGQNTALSVVDNALAQVKADPASMKSSPPDTTHYIRSMIPEDLAPGGVKALGAKTQSTDASATQLKGPDPGIFVVDVVVNNTDPDLTNTDTPNDGETSIAVNPEDPNEIVISAFSGGFNSTVDAPIYHSTDGGLTWTREQQVPKAPGWRGGCPCDWTWDWGRNGELSGTILDQNFRDNDGDNTTFEGNIVSVTTTDPTVSLAYLYLGNPAEDTNINNAPSYGNSDQPWLQVNPDPNTPSQDNVYVAYDDFSGAPDMRVAMSTVANPPDFDVDVKVGEGGGGGTNPGLRLAEDPRTGNMWAIWSQFFAAGDGDSKDMDFRLNRSTDGGITWPLDTFVTFADSTQATPKFGTVNALLGGVHHAAVDPTTGDLYYVHGDRDPGTNKDRLSILKISSDGGGGLIFGPEHFVTGQVEAAIPQVAVLDNGTVGVFYYTFDGFSSDDFPIFTAHLALSEDEGVSFDNHELVTFLSSVKDSCPNVLPTDTCERQRVLGDYMNMVNVGNCFYGSFTANGAPFGRPSANHDPIFFKTCIGPEIQVPSDVEFDDICEGGTASETLEVCNTGTEHLVITSITTTDTQFSVDTPSGGYPVNISPDFCFPFEVDFTPDDSGAANADAIIVSNDESSPTTVALSANAPVGNLVTIMDQDYGDICLGAASTQQLTILNDGACDLEVTNAAITSGGAEFDFATVMSFPFTLQKGESVSADIEFTPIGDVGAAAGEVTISTDDPDTPSKVLSLVGNSPPAAVSTFIADSGAFADTCAADLNDMSLTVENIGACPLQIDSVTIALGANAQPGDFVTPDGDAAGTVISVGNSVQVPIRFSPSAFDNEPPLVREATVNVASHTLLASSLLPNDPTGITGVVPPPDINTAIANDGNFGNVCKGGIADLDLTLFNQGACDLTISNIELVPPDGSFILPSDLDLPLILSHDADFTLPVRYAPTECNDVAEEADIKITSDDPDEMMEFIDISGTSPCPQLVIDPTALSGDFAFPATVTDLDSSLGCYSERTAVLRNNGLCPLTIDSITASAAGEFTVQSPSVFPVILPTGEETLEVTVRFTPQSLGDPLAPDEFTGTLTIVSDDPDGDAEAGLCGEGVAQSGVRVLTTDISSGFPLVVEGVDSIRIRSKGKRTPSPIDLTFTDVDSSTVDICGNTVTYHVDQETLPAVGTVGSNPKSSYEVSAKEGNLQDAQSFVLDQCEFREFQLQLLDSGSDICLLLGKGESCTTDGECCSGKCKGPNGGKTCK